MITEIRAMSGGGRAWKRKRRAVTAVSPVYDRDAPVIRIPRHINIRTRSRERRARVYRLKKKKKTKIL